MRITGGRWRSRAIEAPRGTTTRPTSDRVREALFSMLVSDGVLTPDEETPGPAVLDLYAGTGALAFEALSRGAARAVLVEQGKDAIAAIQKNVKALDALRIARVVASRVDRALDRIDGPFGLVFLDPPYADVPTPAFADILARTASLLATGGVLVLEHASSDAAPAIPGLAQDRSRRHGDTTLTLYVHEAREAL
ncbi:MAG: rRNA ((966)-N(2))-methyltransferase [Labilithrix sp.]|nr:rRNA ((966)-N(2))-methyltransferase [Labilithrix sp.]